ncbi:choice-of-anchor P family protein [Streptacidiphilus pinicola]|nr:choice-of-anchor P family protein [Streptacidiphilus pinicola]
MLLLGLQATGAEAVTPSGAHHQPTVAAKAITPTVRVQAGTSRTANARRQTPAVPTSTPQTGHHRPGVFMAYPHGSSSVQTPPRITTDTPYTHTPTPGSEADLANHGGSVMHGVTVSLVYWLPTGDHFTSDGTDAAYESLQQRWVQDVGGTPYFNVVNQYADSTGHVPNAVSFGGSWTDTQPYPHAGTTTDPLTDGDIATEASHAAAAKGWPQDATHIVVVFTASGIQQCLSSNQCTFPTVPKGGWVCGYHSSNGNNQLYAFMSDSGGDHGAPGNNCLIQDSAPNGNLAADNEVSILSHEISETATDPYVNTTPAWTDLTSQTTGGEIGDKCEAGETGTPYAPKNDSGADVFLHGHPYVLQQEWSNAVHTCAMDDCVISGGTGYVCPPQVTAAETVDNPNPVVGSTVTYTVKVQNNDDTGAALNATVNGPLPSGYTLTSLSAPNSASQSSTSSSFTVSYDTLPVHQAESITVTATVPVQVGQPASACSSVAMQDLLSKAQPTVQSSPCGSTNPGKIPTSVSYTGATTADYHDAFTASANVSGQGSPVSGGTVKFTLGGASCTATTDASGNASCGLTPVDPAGGVTLHADYAGDPTHEASSTTAAFTITHEETTLAYTGPKHVANGVPATLSGVLKEDGTAAIAGRTVQIALGTGSTQQTCSGTTGGDGTVSCTIPTVNQPLNDTATVPVAVTFAGDAYYLPSNASATVRLEYYTGRSYGLSADVNLLLAQLTIPPTPDTGQIRTAQATTTDTPCTATLSTALISADALCANVTTKLAPGTSTATSTVQDATIGIPGLPVIGISGLTATSVSSCTGTRGSATLTLTIAGAPVTVPTAPNSVIGLPGGARLVINEQTPDPSADFGTTVNAVHLIVPGLLGGANTVDVVVGSATSGAHNCS